MSFWTSSDTFRYIKEQGLPYAEAYGNIIKKGSVYTTDAAKRTGCAFCVTGCHLDHPNKFQTLIITNPKLYDYCINKLGIGEFLDFVGVDYS